MTAAGGQTIGCAAVTAWMRAFAAAVARERDHLTELDAAIGDADHGINMERGMQAVLAKLDEPPAAGAGPGGAGSAGVGALLKTVGMTLVSSVGGAAGPLYGTLFLRMATSAGEATELTLEQWATALEAGVAGAQARGKAEPDDKTMIDALVPAVAALRAGVAAGLSLGGDTRDSLDRRRELVDHCLRATCHVDAVIGVTDGRVELGQVLSFARHCRGEGPQPGHDGRH